MARPEQSAGNWQRIASQLLILTAFQPPMPSVLVARTVSIALKVKEFLRHLKHSGQQGWEWGGLTKQ